MGRDLGENAAGFRAGRTAFRPVDLFDVSRQRVGTAGQAADPEMPAGPGYREWSRMDRGSRLALAAAREAMENAGLNGGRMPVVIVNRGETRGDRRASLKIDAGTSEVLASLAERLGAALLR